MLQAKSPRKALRRIIRNVAIAETDYNLIHPKILIQSVRQTEHQTNIPQGPGTQLSYGTYLPSKNLRPIRTKNGRPNRMHLDLCQTPAEVLYGNGLREPVFT
jgi:hypothetical protein